MIQDLDGFVMANSCQTLVDLDKGQLNMTVIQLKKQLRSLRSQVVLVA